MADSEALRVALREAETAILDVAKLIDPAAPGGRQAAEDFEAVGFVVKKWRNVLKAGDWPGRKPERLHGGSGVTNADPVLDREGQHFEIRRSGT